MAGMMAVGLGGGLLWHAAAGFIRPPAPLAPSPERFPGPPLWTRLLAAAFPAYAWADGLERFESAPLSIVLENFEHMAVGGFPKGWKAWRGDDGYARKLYGIREEQGNRYLSAQDDGTSIIIRKEYRGWNPHDYPMLSWRWRARALPEGGDERVGSKNDSAVAVYVVLDQNFIGIPKTLKYVWSTTLPVGTRHRREGIGRPAVIVLESGPGKVGQWVTEKVNVYEDFVRTFGKEPPRSAVGIGVLTDGNATKSRAQGDYDDFVVHRHDAGS
jgi:hypothetical protein